LPSNRAVRMIAADHCYAVWMAESYACMKPRRLHRQSSGPPLQIHRRDWLEIEPGPTDLSYDKDVGHGSNDQRLINPDQLGSASQSTEHLELANMGEAIYGELVQDVLDQDYTCWSMGAGPQ
jgi:hypothetical protein